MDCIFCKILKGEIPADFIHKDKNFVVFKDIHPKAPVHLLLVPTKHIASVKELEVADADLAGKLILLAKDIARDQKLEGYKLVFNVGREGGQLVDHLHLHLLGGWQKTAEKIINV